MQAANARIPEHLMPQPGTAVMFEQGWLERLSKIRPGTVLAIYLPIVLVLAVYGLLRLPPATFVALLVAGLAFWTLFEYLFHRFVFHFSPRTDFGYRLQFIIHGVHHQFPHDKDRLVMPVSVSISVAMLLGVLFWAVLGALTPPFFAGFVLGYLAYDMVHYSIHHLPVPTNALGRLVWKSHLAHHFSDPTRSFGVSTPLWDFIFRTAPQN